jgi:hypothetical protein
LTSAVVVLSSDKLAGLATISPLVVFTPTIIELIPLCIVQREDQILSKNKRKNLKYEYCERHYGAAGEGGKRRVKGKRKMSKFSKNQIDGE